MAALVEVGACVGVGGVFIDFFVVSIACLLVLVAQQWFVFFWLGGGGGG